MGFSFYTTHTKLTNKISVLLVFLSFFHILSLQNVASQLRFLQLRDNCGRWRIVGFYAAFSHNRFGGINGAKIKTTFLEQLNSHFGWVPLFFFQEKKKKNVYVACDFSVLLFLSVYFSVFKLALRFVPSYFERPHGTSEQRVCLAKVLENEGVFVQSRFSRIF